MKQTLKDGFEWDLLSNWRRKGVLTANSGVWKSVKKRLNKRHRKEARRVISEQLD